MIYPLVLSFRLWYNISVIKKGGDTVYFLLLLLPLLATTKVLLQARLSRTEVVTMSDAFRLNGWIFLFSGLVLAALFFRTLPPLPVIFIAAGLAAFTLLFQSCYVQAFRKGPVSLTTTVNNFSILIPLLAGVAFFDDALSPLNIIGIPLLFVAFVLIPMREGKEERGFSWKWLLLGISASVFSGTVSTLLLWISRTEFEAYKSEILVINFLLSSAFAFLLSLRREKESIFRATKKSVGISLLIGIVLGLFNLLSVYAVREISATIYYPVTTVLAILFAVIADFVFFKQRLGKKALIGFCFALVSILLFSL